MQDILDRQRLAWLAAGEPSLAIRRDRLARLLSMIRDHQEAWCAAASADYGGARSAEATMISDLLICVQAIKNDRAHVADWMRPQRRRPNFPFGLLGATARVVRSSKGVVGIVAPWNFPISLAIVPASAALAAGNRAMLKPSELTPQTSALLGELVPRYFADDELAVVTGGPEVAADFCRLEFDHLLFTGSTSVGRAVMRSAAEHLVPVTLELGGKSPVIVGRSANLDKAAKRIAFGKMLNAGQACVAPDYVLVHHEVHDALAAAIMSAHDAMYPDHTSNDLTGVITDRHYARLDALVEDAEQKGARLIRSAVETRVPRNDRRRALQILTDTSPSMTVMQEEIFGPILPIQRFATVEEAIDIVNKGEKPLALYYFGQDPAEEALVLSRTSSGGVAVNDVVNHYVHDDLPFGGIGASGMGAYHGRAGFETFTYPRAIYRQSPIDVFALMGAVPPTGPRLKKTLGRMIGSANKN
jgi:coniferyl-aldehyde dehydrogenase